MFFVSLFFKWLCSKFAADGGIRLGFRRIRGRAESALAIYCLPHPVARCRAVAGYAAFRRMASPCVIYAGPSASFWLRSLRVFYTRSPALSGFARKDALGDAEMCGAMPKMTGLHLRQYQGPMLGAVYNLGLPLTQGEARSGRVPCGCVAA